MQQRTLKLVMVALGVLLSINANAYDVEVDGIYYNLITKAKQATVTSGDSKYTGNVVIPESFSHDGVTYSVTSIGDEAFYECYDLTTVTIPNSVTNIDKSAFRSCHGLTSVAIPESVTTIGDYAFGACYDLTSVSIPNSVTTIGSYAFANCFDLTSVAIPNSVTNISMFTFYGCSGLTSVTIPNSVTSISGNAFYLCSGLTSVYITDLSAWCNITFSYGSNPLLVAHHLFLNGEEVTDLTIPNSVTSIKEEVFSGCSSLTSVTIGNDVRYIGNYAFSGCSGLTSVTIPSSVTSIGHETFKGCGELLDVYCYANNVPSTQSNAFNDSYIEYVTLHVPAASINDYKSTAPWSSFGTIVALDDEGEEESDDVELQENVDTYYNGTEKTLKTLTYTRTFNNTQWQALYVPFSMSYDDWKNDFEVARVNAFYEYDTDNDGVVDKQVLEVLPVKEGNGDLRPNYPYLIKAKTTGEKTISLTDATLYVTEENGIECSTVETKYTFTGTYHKMNGLKSADYYFMSGGGLKTAASDATNLGAFRWYLKTESKGSALLPKAAEIKIRVAGEEEEEDATGIANVETGMAAGKVYSLDGRMVSTDGTEGLKAGLYIVNGKKVFVK